MRGPHTAMKSSPSLPQLEKALAQKRKNPTQPKNKVKFFKKKKLKKKKKKDLEQSNKQIFKKKKKTKGILETQHRNALVETSLSVQSSLKQKLL